MAHPLACILRSRLALGVPALLTLLLSGCIAGGTIPPPVTLLVDGSIAATEPVASAESVDAYLAEAVAADYPGMTAAALRARSQEFAQALMLDAQRAQELEQACRSPVLYDEAHYEEIGSHYTDPLFWTVHLNFVLVEDGPTDDQPGGISPFVGCLMPHWRVASGATTTYQPAAGKTSPTTFQTGAGIPFLCYRMGLAQGGTITTTPTTTTTWTIHEELVPNRQDGRTAFAGGAYLWCPLHIAQSLHAYVFGPDAVPGQTDPAAVESGFQAEIAALAALHGQEPMTLTHAIAQQVADLAASSLVTFPNFISAAALRTLPPAGEHPVLDYLTHCAPDADCGAGFRLYVQAQSSPTDSLPSTATYTVAGNLTLQSPLPRAMYAFYQRCPLDPASFHAGQPIYLIADGGAKSSQAFVRGLPATPPLTGPGSVADCKRISYSPDAGSSPILFWAGESSLFVGHRPDTESYFEGVLDFVWFDPNQAVPTG